MSKKLEFLGACHSPNSVRGLEVTDRKQVWVGDYCYNYTLDSDAEALAKDAVEKHLANCSALNSSECIAVVREQLGLEELKPVVLEIKPKKPAVKRTKKTADKSGAKNTKKKSA